MPDLPEFICEPITPAPGSADATAMSRGEPGLPQRFRWRGAEYAVTQVLKTWKTSTRDRGELYLRRHWYEVETDTGHRMTLYCDRQAQSRSAGTRRWWVYSVGATART